MAYVINAESAREILDAALIAAEEAFHSGERRPVAAPVISECTEKLFASSTQAYREALVGCTVARIVDDRIDIRLPATESGDNAFSGRSLADNVITPFLRLHSIPASGGPYLSSLRGGAKFIPGGAPRIQRDAQGFDSLVSIVQYLVDGTQADAERFLASTSWHSSRRRTNPNSR